MKYVFITGFSQGGTTLFLSLLDGHPEITAYPDEPSFRRIFERRNQYETREHMAADWVFGTPNPLHLSQEVQQQISQGDIKGNIPAVPPSAYSLISQDAVSYKDKKVRGLDNSTFDHESFFCTYYEHLFHFLREPDCTTPRDIVDRSFDALESAIETDESRFRVFKHPMTKINKYRIEQFKDNLDGPIIFIHRHPLARLYSMIKVRENKTDRKGKLRGFSPDMIKLLVHNALDYKEYKKIVSDSRVMTVRYEDVVTSPNETMRAVCDHLGIEFNNILVTPTKLGQTVQIPTSRVRNASTISDDGLHKWRDELTRGEIALAYLFQKLPALFLRSISIVGKRMPAGS